MSTLTSPRTSTVLDRLLRAAERSEREPTPWNLATSFADTPPQQKADALEADYMPVSRSGCHLLYALTRSARPEVVVEFGTSYGISTIHLAAAVADNGLGHVWTTELSATKIAAATQNLDQAGLGALVTVLPGDALQTLAEVPGPIGILLLDGWKDLCLPVLRALEDRLAPGALVIADDTTFDSMADYLHYVRAPENGYITVDFPVEDGMEVSCRA